MWRLAMRTQLRDARSVGSADLARRRLFARINSRAMREAMIECFVTGLLAWRDGQPGQVGNEAATAVFHQCRGSGSSPSFFPLLFRGSCTVLVLVSAGTSAMFSTFPICRCVACPAACRRIAIAIRALHLFFSIGFLACFNEAGTPVRASFRFGFAGHRY